MVAFSMVLALAPISGVTLAALLAVGLGCEINDAAMEPCQARGMDFGPILSDLTSTAGLAEILFLILGVVLIVWVAIEGVALLAHVWRRERAAP